MSCHSCSCRSCCCAVIAVTDRVIVGCDGGSQCGRTSVHHVTISTITIITSLLIHAIAIHMTLLIHASCTHTTTDITTTAAADTDWGGWMIGASTTMMRLLRMTTINRNGYGAIPFLLVFGIDTQ